MHLLLNQLLPFLCGRRARAAGTYRYTRLPTTGPGAPVKEVSGTYEALDSDRKLYGDGLGNRSNVPGLDSNATYYHGVCSRAIAERALLSQGILSGNW